MDTNLALVASFVPRKTNAISILFQIFVCLNLSKYLYVCATSNFINDNKPKFLQSDVRIQLYENTTIDSPVIHLQAIDLDKYDMINYNITSGNSEGYFKIDEDYLVVANKLDYEHIKRFDLKINATDNNGNYDILNVDIEIINVLDEPPRFFNSPYNISWYENDIGILGQFQAIGEATNNQTNRINYLLKNNFEQLFYLNSSNALLSAVKPIDRESLSENFIELRIIAIDTLSPQLTGEGIIYLTIYDVNDNPPAFNHNEYKISLKEDHFYRSNEVIGTVSAYDNDSNDTLTYYLIEDIESQLFHVENSTGKIFPKIDTIFDRETKEHYEFYVFVTDNKFKAKTKVKIDIIDVNDCKPIITSINGEEINSQLNKIKIKIPFVKLNVPINENSVLFGVSADDCDKEGTKSSMFKFNLNDSYNSLKIDPFTGIVKSTQKFQHQNLATFNCDLIVTDLDEINPLSTHLKIELQIVNENNFLNMKLIKTPLPKITIPESIQINKSILNFDSIVLFKNIDFIIIGGDPYKQFKIDKNFIKIKNKLDYEQTKSYVIYIEAIRKNKDFLEFQQFQLEIQVLNENDMPPQFDYEVYNVSIFEEIEQPILVTQVIATDKDSDQEFLKYKILNSEEIPFKINEKSGEIWTTTKIDREVNPHFLLVVSAEDQGSLSTTCKVDITINDKNDNPPRFTRLFSVNIIENAPIGTFVIQVTSSDKDLGSNALATYSFIEPSKHFTIESHTGKIFVASNLDREEREEYLLMVSANDGSWKTQTTLTINILDENDSPPIFEKEKYEFFKSSSTISTIGKVKAIDADKGINAMITYKLKHKSPYFSINSQTGEISLKESPKLVYNLELSFLNRHNLTIIATDKGHNPKSGSTLVIINILPHHNSTMESVKIKIPVPYNLKNHTLLYITSSNLKPENLISEILIPKSNEILFFGENLVKPNDVYLFRFASVFEKLEIELFITEENKYSPYFINTEKQINVTENKQMNEPIFQAKALDNDTDNYNNLISYDFQVEKINWNNKAMDYISHYYSVNENVSFSTNGLNMRNFIKKFDDLRHLTNPFAINSSSGELYLSNRLKYEIANIYYLKIIAYDNAWFNKNTTFELEVNVIDVKDNFDMNIAIIRNNNDSVVSVDPMSIGIVLVILFFIILIMVISTSFIIFHKQKKKQQQNCNNNKRKMPNTTKHHLSHTPTPSPPSTLMHPTSQMNGQNLPQNHIISSISMLTHSLPMQQQTHPPPTLTNSKPPSRSPDVIEPPPVPAPILQLQTQRVPPAVPSFNRSPVDNYSDMLAIAENYDLENSSRIAPSDIDIVYHYNGFRNRDSATQQDRHAPLARLSPSVSELSSVPRILTLQDLSPSQVPPCPPPNLLAQRKSLQQNADSNDEDNNNDDDSNDDSNDDDDDDTDDSFTCSENYENFEISKKDKSMIFERVW